MYLLLPPAHAAILSTLFASPQAARTLTVVSETTDLREAVVRFSMPAPRDFAGVQIRQQDHVIPAQASVTDGNAEITFLVSDLKKGVPQQFRLLVDKTGRPVPTSGVIVEKRGQDVDVRINQQLFFTYNTSIGPNKSYLFPIFGPGGRQMVRNYPIKTGVPGETSDHPHHRGLWFTHGEVNGADFWMEGEGRAGRQVHTGFPSITSGSVFGRLVATSDWVKPDGRKIAEDRRELTVYNVRHGRVLDYTITVKALDEPLHFGDTKEGSFGMRVPDSMRQKGGVGSILTSKGIRDAAAWGTRAEWVDYYGTVEGSTQGVAIMDHPGNLRHPTYWHVRDYGLFAANPFGIHDFVKGTPKGEGDHVVPAKGSLTLRYRVFFHEGDTTSAGVAEVWAAFANPPKVELK
jgi:hypothetical protein